jgi:hypothetical protein
MKRFTITICTACIILFSCNDSKTDETTASTDSTKTATDTSAAIAPPMDSAAMMQAWQAYMTPGGVHQMLAKSNGTWEGDVTMWMEPGKPPIKSKSTTVNKMIFGGRYQQSTHKGDMMGMPFEGMSTLGFDNAKKVLVSTWIDNMGTGIMTMEGTWDSTTNTANLKGKMVDPMTGKDMECRETFTMIDDNSQKLEMFCTQQGKEMKTMEILYKRK